jgi:Na+(H+)/acetate symporter ActP
MDERAWWLELLGGLAGAIAVPLLLSVLWGRFRMAGAIAGVMLAVLLHVTVGLAVILLGYQVLERFAARSPRLARALGVTAAFAALAVFGWFTLA